MATITIPARAIGPAEFVSPATAVPAGLQSATIAMTSCPEWATASGFFAWAVEASFDGGLSWRTIVDQGYTDPQALAIGALSRAGGLPSLTVGWSATLGNARVRAKAKTDGAALTCAFTVTTSP